jgi:hypothetical protein
MTVMTQRPVPPAAGDPELADRGDVNVVFVPRTHGRYYEYAAFPPAVPLAG